MREETVKVYKFAELSDEAKESARNWWRSSFLQDRSDNYWAESVTDDFKELLKACGFELERKNNRDVLYWSGFGHQGQGACFGAHWSAAKVDTAAMLKDRPEHPSNNAARACLHAADALKANFPEGYGDIEARDRYMTSCVDSVDFDSDSESDSRDALLEQLQTLVDDLSHEFFRSLEREWDYMLSDEQVSEAIEANAYEFTEDGGCWE